MRIAVLSDIHANALALEAVIRQARAEGCDTFWFLGDLVGRGPRPMDALRLLQAQAPAVWLSGNWDEGLVNDAFRDTFARHWWQVLEWQRMMLSRRDLEALQRALQGRPAIVIPKPGIHLAHGAFFLHKRKSLTEYWMSGMNVVLLFQHWQQWRDLFRGSEPDSLPEHVLVADHAWREPFLLLMGHSHEQSLWRVEEQGCTRVEIQTGRWYAAGPQQQWIANPGSVGNPRDDWRASFLLLEGSGETWRFRFYRLPYDIAALRRQLAEYYPAKDGMRDRLLKLFE